MALSNILQRAREEARPKTEDIVAAGSREEQRPKSVSPSKRDARGGSSRDRGSTEPRERRSSSDTHGERISGEVELIR